jgi:hypothetical protein
MLHVAEELADLVRTDRAPAPTGVGFSSPLNLVQPPVTTAREPIGRILQLCDHDRSDGDTRPRCGSKRNLLKSCARLSLLKGLGLIWVAARLHPNYTQNGLIARKLLKLEWWRRRELNPRPRKPAMKRLRCVSGSNYSVAAVRAGENSRFLVRLISALGSGPKPATYPAK